VGGDKAATKEVVLQNATLARVSAMHVVRESGHKSGHKNGHKRSAASRGAEERACAHQ
jgi:hypothetical protein